MNKTAYIIGVRISSLLRHTHLCSRIKAYISITICTVRAFISAPKNSKLVSPFSISLSPLKLFYPWSVTKCQLWKVVSFQMIFILLVSLFYNYICESSFKTWVFSCVWVYKIIWWEFLLWTGINVGSLFHFVCASQYLTACESSGMPQMNRILKQVKIICNYCKWHRLWWKQCVFDVWG